MFYGGNVGEPKDLDLPLKAKMISNWKISMLGHVCNKIFKFENFKLGIIINLKKYSYLQLKALSLIMEKVAEMVTGMCLKKTTLKHFLNSY